MILKTPVDRLNSFPMDAIISKASQFTSRWFPSKPNSEMQPYPILPLTNSIPYQSIDTIPSEILQLIPQWFPSNRDHKVCRNLLRLQLVCKRWRKVFSLPSKLPVFIEAYKIKNERTGEERVEGDAYIFLGHPGLKPLRKQGVNREYFIEFWMEFPLSIAKLLLTDILSLFQFDPSFFRKDGTLPSKEYETIIKNIEVDGKHYCLSSMHCRYAGNGIRRNIEVYFCPSSLDLTIVYLLQHQLHAYKKLISQ